MKNTKLILLFVTMIMATMFMNGCQKTETDVAWDALDITGNTWILTSSTDLSGEVLYGSGLTGIKFHENGTADYYIQTDSFVLWKETVDWSYKKYSSTLKFGDEVYKVSVPVSGHGFYITSGQEKRKYEPISEEEASKMRLFQQ